MSATVYRQDRDGTLTPVAHSDLHGQQAILDALLHKVTVPGERTTFVAYDDAEGTELEVRG